MLGKRLLVADDSLTIQKVIKLALSSEGYEIQTVSDGNDALQQISLFRPDVVLVDVSLPEKNAFDLKRETNEQPDLNEVRFVLMSSAYEKVDESAYRSLGFHARLTKPFDPAHLRQILNSTREEIQSKRTEKTSSFERPVETPPAPPPAPPPVIETLPSMEPPAQADALWQESPPEQDIKELTESTIKMSGLDDLQWSVEERAKKPLEPMEKEHLPPPPTFLADEFAAPLPEPTLPPLPNMLDLGGSGFTSYDLPPPPPASLAPSIELPPEIEFQTHFESHDSQPPPAAQVSPLAPEQVEALVRAQLEETLQKMAREVLPGIAERIIKQEINRLLEEQP